MKYISENLLSILASDNMFNKADRKIGCSLPWSDCAGLIFKRSIKLHSAKYDLRSRIYDRPSATMIWSSESVNKLVILSMNLRSFLPHGEEQQILMVEILKALKYNSYKRKVEITKNGHSTINTHSGIRILYVFNEIPAYPSYTSRPLCMSDCKGRVFWTKQMGPLNARCEANWIEFQSMNHEMATDIAFENTLEVRRDCWVNRDGVLSLNSNRLLDLPGNSSIIKNLALLWVLPIRVPFVDERARRRTVYHGRAQDYIMGIHRLLGLLLCCNELAGVGPIL